MTELQKKHKGHPPNKTKTTLNDVFNIVDELLRLKICFVFKDLESEGHARKVLLTKFDTECPESRILKSKT